MPRRPILPLALTLLFGFMISTLPHWTSWVRTGSPVWVSDTDELGIYLQSASQAYFNHVYRLTPEFYYGLADTIELGLYLLTTTAAGNSPNYDGEKVRVKYIAPHDESQGSFLGVNFEIGKTSQRVSQVPWNAELKGIYGYRAGPWTFAVNPNFDWTMSGWASGSVSLNIDSKVAYQTGSDYQVGFETYNALGPLRDLGHLSQLSQTLFAVIDTKLGNFDLNAGIGHGLTGASDHWLAKLIVGIHY